MGGWLTPIFWVIDQLLSLFIIVLIVRIALSWLEAFQVINIRNKFVRMIHDIAYRLTEPVMRPVQRVIPSIGGLDLSPIVIFLGVYVIRMYLAKLAIALA